MQKTFKEKAQEYESPKAKNIVELDKIDVNVPVIEKTYKEGSDDEFTLNVLEESDGDYRVPDSVLKDLKVILEDNPSLKYFKVRKSGEGMKTKYTVIPLVE